MTEYEIVRKFIAVEEILEHRFGYIVHAVHGDQRGDDHDDGGKDEQGGEDAGLARTRRWLDRAGRGDPQTPREAHQQRAQHRSRDGDERGWYNALH